MEVQLSFFLIPYIVFVLIFLFYTFSNIYHIVKFGFVSFFSYLITFAYIVVTIATLFVSYFYIAQVNWDATIQIINPVSFNL
jgi:hypothetical protein